MFEQYSNEIIIIKIAKVIEKDDLPAGARLIKTWLLNPAQFHVIDFSGVNTYDEGYRALLASYAETLKRYKKIFGCINMSDTLKKQLNEKELLLLNVKQDLEALAGNKARRGVVPKKKPIFKLDANYLNLFVEKLKYVFEEQVGIPLRNLEPHVKGSQPNKFEPDIVSLVTVNSEYISGSLSLSFPSSTFLKVYNKMVDENHDVINNENKDAAAELLNMIYGLVKQSLNQNEKILNMGIPEVLMGDALKKHIQKAEKIIIIGFQTQFGYFNFEVILESV